MTLLSVIFVTSNMLDAKRKGQKVPEKKILMLSSALIPAHFKITIFCVIYKIIPEIE